MTAEELLQRADLVGGIVETQEEGLALNRGTILAVELQQYEFIWIHVDSLKRFTPEGWIETVRRRVVFPSLCIRNANFRARRLQFGIPYIGKAVLYCRGRVPPNLSLEFVH